MYLTKRRKAIDCFVVALDETTHYCVRDEHKSLIAEIRGIYMLDRNEITYCCELTPSYYLIYIQDQVILTPEADKTLTDEEKGSIYEEYEQSGGDNIYVHCRQIDNIIRSRKKVHHYGKTGVKYSDSSYEEQIEGLREHFQGNSVL